MDFTEIFTTMAGLPINNEFIKMTIAFLIAAKMHRQWVKKDLTEQFKLLTDAIDNVSKSVTQGLTLHSKRIDELSERVNTLENNNNKSKENKYERV